MRARIARWLLAAARRLDSDVAPSDGSILGPPSRSEGHGYRIVDHDTWVAWLRATESKPMRAFRAMWPRFRVGDRVVIHTDPRLCSAFGPRDGDVGTVTWASENEPWVAQVELDTYRHPHARWDFMSDRLERID